MACLASAMAGAPRSAASRLITGAVLCGLLSSVWLVQALYFLDFYGPGGALAGMQLALFVVPAWRGDHIVWRAFAGGIAASCLFADAYAYGPAAALFLVSGGVACWRIGRKQLLFWHLAGAAAGAGALLSYLLIWGDVRGYFAYHIIESQVYYSRYINFSWQHFLIGLYPSWSPPNQVSTFAVVCALIAATGFSMNVWAGKPQAGYAWVRILEIVLGTIAVLSLNMRGSTNFRNGSLLVCAITFLALAVGELAADGKRRFVSATLIVTAALDIGSELAMRRATYSPFSLTRQTYYVAPSWPLPGPGDGEELRRIRKGVRPDERMLALVYQPQLYLNADRLPINGFYSYFPWDADYDRDPWLGVRRDLCATLRRAPPPLVAYDGWSVPGHDLRGYAGCLFLLLKTDYIRDALFPQYYWRRDRAGMLGLSDASSTSQHQAK
jgi:hypothetical protein